MNVIRAYHEELKHWRLTDEQKGLVMAFLYCLKLRMDGVDFERHWDAMCGQERAAELGRDYYD